MTQMQSQSQLDQNAPILIDLEDTDEGFGAADLAFTSSSSSHSFAETFTAPSFQSTQETRQQSMDAAAADRLTQGLQTIMDGARVGRDYDLAINSLLALFKDTEKHILKSLSMYLCHLQDVPDKIVKHLAYDALMVAEPMLEHSVCLSEKELLNIIFMKGAGYWKSIAKRTDLTDNLVETLAEKKDFVTSMNLLTNSGAKIGPRAFNHVRDLARKRNELSPIMAQRSDIPVAIALDIYWQVSNALREKLVVTHNIPKERLNEAFKSALKDFDDSLRGMDDPTPTPLMRELASSYQKAGKITTSMLVKTLFVGRARFFIALFSQMTGVHSKVIFEAMRQPGGRSIALLCRAHNVGKENFVSIFLKSRSLIHSRKAVDSTELHAAIRYFDRLDPAKARRIIETTLAS